MPIIVLNAALEHHGFEIPDWYIKDEADTDPPIASMSVNSALKKTLLLSVRTDV